ncbi:hypothetical protein LCGC14_2160720 [marine sediment metagenome]|uniref:Uncharacterized protein n=1 Tax=marine sediment metagenome TaxID=412755 RepID=A0A0F9GP14_9ZZZZ
MDTRLCPVCRKGKIWRNYVKTCSRYCSLTWSTWSPSMQASAVEAAQGDTLESIEDLNEEVPSKPSFLK